MVTGSGLQQWTRILPSAIILVAWGWGWPGSEPSALCGDEFRDQLQFIRPACRMVERLWAPGWEVRWIKRGCVLPFTCLVILASPFIPSVHYSSSSLNFCVRVVLPLNSAVPSFFPWCEWIFTIRLNWTVFFLQQSEPTSMVLNAYNLCVRAPTLLQPPPLPNYAETARNMELCPLFSLLAARRALTQHRKLRVPLAATQTFTPQCTHMHTCARTGDMHTTTCVRAHAHMHAWRRCRWTREIFRSRKKKKTNERQSRFHRANLIPIFSAVMNLYRWHTSWSFPRPPAVVVGQDEDRIQMGPRKMLSFFKATLLKRDR